MSEPRTAVACRNCGTAVADRFCPRCGQSRDLRPLSLFALLREGTRETFSGDARLWRTLGVLLGRPGRLTEDWVYGRRVRYLPTPRLYIGLNVLAIVLISLGADLDLRGSTSVESEAQALERLDADISRLRTAGVRTDDERLARLIRMREALGGPSPAATAPVAELEAIEAERRGIALEAMVDWLAGLGFDRERIETETEALADRPERLVESVVDNVPFVLVVLLPILATLLWLLYVATGTPWMVHLVGLAHLHAFFFTVIAVVEGVEAGTLVAARWGAPLPLEAIGAWLAWGALGLVALYVVVWLRRLYGHGFFGVLAMAAVILALHAIGVALALAAALLGSLTLADLL